MVFKIRTYLVHSVLTSTSIFAFSSRDEKFKWSRSYCIVSCRLQTRMNLSPALFTFPRLARIIGERSRVESKVSVYSCLRLVDGAVWSRTGSSAKFPIRFSARFHATVFVPSASSDSSFPETRVPLSNSSFRLILDYDHLESKFLLFVGNFFIFTHFLVTAWKGYSLFFFVRIFMNERTTTITTYRGWMERVQEWAGSILVFLFFFSFLPCRNRSNGQQTSRRFFRTRGGKWQVCRVV